MSQKLRQVVISKEDAVFWMDKNGVWHNAHGRFEHPRIIKYFNAAIKKDENGYYVHQTSEACEEKVYFRHEDTALFVVDINFKNGACLILNTSETLGLEQGDLFIKEDQLYIQTRDHRIKFSANALVKLSRFMKEKEGQVLLKISDTKYPIKSL